MEKLFLGTGHQWVKTKILFYYIRRKSILQDWIGFSTKFYFRMENSPDQDESKYEIDFICNLRYIP